MKKSDIIKELKTIITDITILTEPETLKYINVFPEINKPWWTKSDGYFSDDKGWVLSHNPESQYKKVVYKNEIKSVGSEHSTIGIRPIISVKSPVCGNVFNNNKINIGIYSFTIIENSNGVIRALCDSIIGRRRIGSFRCSGIWNQSDLREWLETDGLIRIFASPDAISDWGQVSDDALFWNKSFENDCDRFEWILKQTFRINDALQKSIDEHVKTQMADILPVVTTENELKKMKFGNTEFEPQISNMQFNMIKESYFLDWKYRLHLENIGFGRISEWLDADKSPGTYCYCSNGTGRLYNFYPKDINNPLAGHTLTCTEGTFMRPLIFIYSSDIDRYNIGDVGYVFEEKVIVIDKNDKGLFVTTTTLPRDLYPLYKRQSGLDKYKRELELFGSINLIS